MTIIKEWPVLHANTKLGKLKYWLVEVSDDGCTHVSYWQQDGKVQTKVTQRKGKNIGKKNATTPVEQALKEAESMWLEQRQSGYVAEGEVSTIKPLPMKAQTYAYGDKLPEYVYTQPKYNGLRMCWSKSLGAYSKKGLEFGAIKLDIDTDYILDGEIKLPPPYTFQDTVSAVKAYKETTPLLIYTIYDLVIPNISYTDRLAELQAVYEANKHLGNLELIETNIARSIEDIKEQFNKYVGQGHEGIMIRIPDGFYECGYRSKYLLKYKDFLDKEFEIIDVVECDNAPGLGKFKCLIPNPEDDTIPPRICDVTPEGPIELKQKYLLERKALIGKMLTVKFQAYTDDFSLQFCTGISVREYE